MVEGSQTKSMPSAISQRHRSYAKISEMPMEGFEPSTSTLLSGIHPEQSISVLMSVAL